MEGNDLPDHLFLDGIKSCRVIDDNPASIFLMHVVHEATTARSLQQVVGMITDLHDAIRNLERAVSRLQQEGI